MCLAVPGKVLEATDIGISRIAKVEFGGITRQVYLDFVPEVQPGDYVLVHVGFAISRVEPEEAERTYELLRQMAEAAPEAPNAAGAAVKYLDEYRDAAIARALAARIRGRLTRPRVLMEICGGQTHTIMRYGLPELLPAEIELVHGPGCPVCVTPLEMVDRAIEIAARPGVIFVSYGDTLRVPGSHSDLLRVKAAGGDVRIAYSPMEAVKLARENPERPVVFFGIGFETTAPANAMAVWQAKREGLSNFSMLVSHVLVPPAMRLILGSPANRVEGFIAPGHVCAVMGFEEYEALSAEFRVPIVVGGFEPVDLLEAIAMLVDQLEDGRAELENQYSRSVTRSGSAAARKLMQEVFEVTGRQWRGIGPIPASGYRLREPYTAFDADRAFSTAHISVAEPPECIAAQVMLGRKKPLDCPAFGTPCTPERPLGAPMVSGEGACAAYYTYRRHVAPHQAPEVSR